MKSILVVRPVTHAVVPEAQTARLLRPCDVVYTHGEAPPRLANREMCCRHATCNSGCPRHGDSIWLAVPGTQEPLEHMRPRADFREAGHRYMDTVPAPDTCILALLCTA